MRGGSSRNRTVDLRRGCRWRSARSSWAWPGRLRSVAQAEEAWPVPVRAGDGARDLREAAVGGAVPGEAVRDHDDPVQGAGMLAHELGAGLERTPLWERRDRRHEPARGLVARGTPRFALAGDLVEEAQGRAIEVTIGIGLDAVGDDAQEKRAGKVRRRAGAEELAPAPPKRVKVEIAEAGDLVPDRVGLERARRTGRAHFAHPRERARGHRKPDLAARPSRQAVNGLAVRALVSLDRVALLTRPQPRCRS